jgi:heptosyltransferase-2
LLTDAVTPLPRSVHQVEHYLALGAPAGMFRPKEPALAWTITPADRAEAERFLAGAGLGRRDRFVAFAPGASFGPAKRWLTGHWARLADRLLLEHGDQVVLVGGAEERGIAARIAAMTARPVVSAAGALSLGGTAALIARSRGFVSNDSGLMHIGAAVGARTIGLFGSSNPAWTRPFARTAQALWGHVPCAPCFRRTCLPGRGYACQAALTVDAVTAALTPG